MKNYARQRGIVTSNSVQGTVANPYPDFTTKTVGKVPGTWDYVANDSNDVSQINTAAQNGKVIKLSRGIFNINGRLNFGNNILSGAGRTQTILYIDTTVDNVLQWQGSKIQVGSNGVITGANAGTKVINVNTDLRGTLSPGQIIMICTANSSNNPALVMNGNRSYYTNGEYCTVVSVEIDKINVLNNLYYNYNDAPASSIHRYTWLDTVGMENLSIVVNPALAVDGNSLTQILYANNPFFRNCEMEGNFRQGRGFFMEECRNGLMKFLWVKKIADINGGSGRTGYGVSFEGMENGLAEWIFGEENRHTFDVSKANRQAHSSGTVCRHFVCKNDYLSFSDHGGNYDLTAEDIEIWDPEARHLIARGAGKHVYKNIRLKGSIQNGNAAAVIIGEQAQTGSAFENTPFLGPAGTDITFEDLDIDIQGSDDNFIIGEDPLTNFTLRRSAGNTSKIKGADRDFMWLKGVGNQQITLENLEIIFNNPQDNASYIIHADPGATGAGTTTITGTATDIVIDNALDTTPPMLFLDSGASGSIVETRVSYI